MPVIFASPAVSEELAAMPTLPVGGLRGEQLTLLNRGTGPILLSDEAQLGGSKLKLRTPQISLGVGGALLLTWDGQFWVEHGRSTIASSGAGIVHVADFGAVGDGVTDDAAAIQRAITAATAEKKQVAFDALTYLVKSEISLDQHGTELVGLGSANSQRTIIKAGASMRSVLFCGGASYLRISQLQLDANRNASYACLIQDSSFSQFTNVQFLSALLDGINVSVFGTNDHNSFVDCWSYANGKVWCTSGFNTFFTNYTKGVATGTVSCTSGDLNILGSGTNFTQMGIRSGDFFRIGTGIDGDQFLQISEVVDDTHMKVGSHKTPTASLSGQGYAVATGNGYRETRHNDNNINFITRGLWRLNAGSGMSFNGLYGPSVDHVQADLNGFYGIVLGTTDQEVVYASKIDHPYFEGNLAAPFLFGCCIGVTVDQPQYGQGSTLYHIGTSNQNIGVIEDYDGIKPIGDAICTMPVTTSALTSFLVNGKLLNRGEVQIPVAATPIAPAPHLILLSLSAPVTMTATPTIAAGDQDGHEVILYNQGAGSSLVLQDEATLPGSKLKLSAATVTLAIGQSIRLMYLTGFWRQM